MLQGSPTTPSPSVGARRGFHPIWPCLALLLLKLWLVRDREIVAIDNSFDQLRYAQMADDLRNGRWLGAYDRFTLLRRVGFPAWVAIVSHTGIPLRVASEVLLALAACVWARTLASASQPAWLCTAACAAIVLNPHSLVVNDQLMTETLYTPGLILLLSGLVSLVLAAEPALAGAALTGLALGWLSQTRPEGAYLALLFLGAVGIKALVRIRGPRPRVPLLRGLLLPALLLLTVSGALSLGVRVLNGLAYGVFVTQDMYSPGVYAAYKSLLRIQPDAPRRFVSVPESSRRKAYAVSPAFRTLEPFLEGPLKASWTIDSCKRLGVCDDYANGWFVFALRDAASLCGHYRSAPETDAFYRQIAGELRRACDEGRVACGSDAWGFLPPRAATYLPWLPASLARTAGLLVGPVEADPRGAVPEGVDSLFDAVANRRSLYTGSIQLVGWAFATEGRVSAVTLRSAEGAIMASTTSFLPRTDVVAYFSKRGLSSVSRDTGFALAARTTAAAPVLSGASLVFSLDDGSEWVVPARGTPVAGPRVRYAIDVAKETVERSAARRTLEGWLAGGHRLMVLGLSALTAAALFVAGVLGRGSRPRAEMAVVIALLALAVAARLFLIALVDASSFGAEVRYVYPVAGLFTCLLVVTLHEAGGPLLARLRPERLMGPRVEDHVSPG